MKFFNSFKNKRLRLGALSTVMVLFAVAIFVFVNLVAGQLNVTADLTGEQLFSLSEYSVEYLTEELATDVKIYSLMPTGQENLLLTQLLDEYKAVSPRITVENRDPNLYPTFVEQFAEPDQPVEASSIIVQSGDRHRVIAPDEMFTTQFNQQTFQEEVTGINFESSITKAIHYVTLTDSSVIYHVNGNGEYALPESFSSYLSNEGYEFKTVDLLLNEVPEDCDVLLITAPQRDWSTDETKRIQDFLDNNGNAVFVMGYSQTRFTNVDNLLAGYGVKIGDYIVVEGDTAHAYGGMPTFLIPDITANEATQALVDANSHSIMIQATGIDELELKRSSTQYSPILTTSNQAYGKQNPESATANKEPGDLEGPFNLGLTVTDSVFTDTTYTTNIAIYGSETILAEEVNYNYSGGANWALLVSGISSMVGAPESIYVPSKPPGQVAPLMITQFDANIMMFVSVIVLPLIFVAAGAFVWYRRRHS